MYSDRAMLINQMGIIGIQLNFIWHKVGVVAEKDGKTKKKFNYFYSSMKYNRRNKKKIYVMLYFVCV